MLWDHLFKISLFQVLGFRVVGFRDIYIKIFTYQIETAHRWDQCVCTYVLMTSMYIHIFTYMEQTLRTGGTRIAGGKGNKRAHVYTYTCCNSTKLVLWDHLARVSGFKV